MEPSQLSPEANCVVHFREFVQRLAEKFEPLLIFSFSQNICAQDYQGCIDSNQGNFKCDHCLLVVTETATRVDYEMQDFASTHYKNGTITIICHGRQSIWDAINANSRFFKTVFTSGEFLYSHNGILVKPFVQPYNPIKANFKATRHYEHRMSRDKGMSR